jgi:hypothetical protein
MGDTGPTGLETLAHAMDDFCSLLVLVSLARSRSLRNLHTPANFPPNPHPHLQPLSSCSFSGSLPLHCSPSRRSQLLTSATSKTSLRHRNLHFLPTRRQSRHRRKRQSLLHRPRACRDCLDCPMSRSRFRHPDRSPNRVRSLLRPVPSLRHQPVTSLYRPL